MSDRWEIAKDLLDRALKADPYGTGFEQGLEPKTGPGANPVVSAKNFDHPLERNVNVGGLWVSSCICPQCGERYAHVGTLAMDDPDPPCWRCELSLGLPLDPEEAAAMAEFRWRYDRFLEAIDVGGGKIGKTESDMRRTFVTACDSGMVYAPVLLRALERRYGNQVDAGVQAILNGVSGVVEDSEAKS